MTPSSAESGQIRVVPPASYRRLTTMPTASQRRGDRASSGSTPTRCSALPPIDRWPITHDVRGQLGVAEVAELPQFLRRPRVLEEGLVDAEGIQLATAESVDRGAHALHQGSQLALVVRRYGLARGLSVGLRGHRSRLVRALQRRDIRHHEREH